MGNRTAAENPVNSLRFPEGGAESGAPGTQTLQDPELRVVVDAWPVLPLAVRQTIMVLIQRPIKPN
jgi:hypothetical protein